MITFGDHLSDERFKITPISYKHIAYNEHNNTDAYLWQAKELTFLELQTLTINKQVTNKLLYH